MKSKLVILAGLAALGAAVYLSTRSGAQTTATAQRLNTKIAVVNLQVVIKNYKKYLVYDEELKRLGKSFQEREADLKNKATTIQNDQKLSQDAKDQQLTDLKRKAEDLQKEFKKEISTKMEQQLVTLYRDVEDMVKRVAVAQGFEMVLQYGDADPKDAYNPMVIQRKLLEGRCLPIYAANGLDITTSVYKYLNAEYDRAAGTSPGAPAHR